MILKHIVLSTDIVDDPWEAGFDGEQLFLLIEQDAKGGHTYKYPKNIRGGARYAYTDPTANPCNAQYFIYISNIGVWLPTTLMYTGI